MGKFRDDMLFQGHPGKKHYFEGWYFKQTSLQTGRTVSFIPGISLHPGDRHAFIQVILGPPVETHYFRYPLADFHAENRPFQIRIGKSSFSCDRVRINLSDNHASISGELKFGPFTEIRKSLLMPNIMGWFAYMPGMACRHGVISMAHEVNGSLLSNGRELRFEQDRGYIEKDWGTSFPERYIWLQASHFARPDISIMASVASIPLAGRSFMGHLANLQAGDEEFRFGTYNRSKIVKASRTGNLVETVLRRGEYLLEIRAEIDEDGSLKAPVRGGMHDTIKEGLNGRLDFQLSRNKEIFLEGSSGHAGIEAVRF